MKAGRQRAISNRWPAVLLAGYRGRSRIASSWADAMGLLPFDLRVIDPRRGVFQLEAVRFMLEQ